MPKLTLNSSKPNNQEPMVDPKPVADVIDAQAESEKSFREAMEAAAKQTVKSEGTSTIQGMLPARRKPVETKLPGGTVMTKF